MAKLTRRIKCLSCGDTVEPTEENEHTHMKSCKCGNVRADIGGPNVREYLNGPYHAEGIQSAEILHGGVVLDEGAAIGEAGGSGVG